MSALQQGGHAHKQHVEQQFGGQAAAYLSSQVHAEGAEFAELRQAAAEHGAARVLDLGCGAGHVGFQVAEAAREVVAYDLSAAMLEVVAAEAARRGLDNLGTQQGAAERRLSPMATSIWCSAAIPPITGAMSAWRCARRGGC